MGALQKLQISVQTLIILRPVYSIKTKKESAMALKYNDFSPEKKKINQQKQAWGGGGGGISYSYKTCFVFIITSSKLRAVSPLGKSTKNVNARA